MTIVDDRTLQEMDTHRFGVVARDKFLSGWGGATGGHSRCAWACSSGADQDKVEKWVLSRSDMKYVNAGVDLNAYRPPRGTVHFHIYVVHAGHPALG
jgi:hypothetical protein